MNITIEGVDTFTHNSPFYFTVSVNLMEEDFDISYDEDANTVVLYISGQRYISNREEFKIY